MKQNQIDEYITAQPQEVRAILQAIRETIQKAAPEAEETMNYNIPAFSLVKGGKRDKQIMFAAFKKHIGFYPFPSTIEAFEKELIGYKAAKGSVQFPLKKPIPFDLIAQMVSFRLSEIQANQGESNE